MLRLAVMMLTLCGLGCRSEDRGARQPPPPATDDAEHARIEYLQALHAASKLVNPGSDAWNALGLGTALGPEVDAPLNSELVTLDSTSDLLLCRTDHVLYVVYRSGDGCWLVASCRSIPLDWLADVRRGFSTYVDDALLNAAFWDLVNARKGARQQDVVDALSSTSPLVMAGVPQTGILFEDEVRRPLTLYPVDPGDWYDVQQFHLLVAEGRYAIARVVARHTHEGKIDGSRALVHFRNSDSVVVFRADNGKEWKVFSILDLAVSTGFY